ncbi:tetratricopeptide repeat protein [Trifolium pratense]|uniref:Tetratricopeptide repeat protein n=1 Tax=Trifolium pratense TaxID=57577 RepID=A0A2K3PIB9_TRIPR|nr:tetratricopeptide repeat protein [Trifolium pratense]
MVGACRASPAPPISHLPLRNLKTFRIQNCSQQSKASSPPHISIAQLPNRRLFLFSLPLSTFLFLPLPAFSEGDSVISTEYDPVTRSERDASALISQRISLGIELLEKGRDLQAQGDFNGALQYFSQVIESYKDLAFSEYARVGRALALYEVGDREEAIAEMEDVSISLKGYPEVHAALAAALYADKHAALLAENQFTIATLLDPHFTDLSYVRDTKHWPPSLISSLQHFITLS